VPETCQKKRSTNKIAGSNKGNYILGSYILNPYVSQGYISPCKPSVFAVFEVFSFSVRLHRQSQKVTLSSPGSPKIPEVFAGGPEVSHVTEPYPSPEAGRLTDSSWS
jgi:hypothetical protein